jgi:hypothetical protein
MDLWTPVTTGMLVALLMGIQAWINKGRFDALARRMDAHEQRLERRFVQLAGEIAQLRSDLLQLVLALTPRQQTG